MSFEPIKPEAHHPPLKVAEDTWLIQQIQEAAAAAKLAWKFACFGFEANSS